MDSQDEWQPMVLRHQIRPMHRVSRWIKTNGFKASDPSDASILTMNEHQWFKASDPSDASILIMNKTIGFKASEPSVAGTRHA